MTVKLLVKMTERFPLLQDNPSDVEKLGACPGSLSPPLGRNREPGTKLLLQATSSLEHKGSKSNAELGWVRDRGRSSSSQLIPVHSAGIQVRLSVPRDCSRPQLWTSYTHAYNKHRNGKAVFIKSHF